MGKIFLILFILFLGVLYNFKITYGGNFTFNMDFAADMVNVREMVILQKPRLIAGGSGGIEGLFYGPGWYYLLSIPFVFSSGDPYGVVIMQIILWVIGGYFLLKLTSRWGLGAILVAGSIWIASHYIVTAMRVPFSPNSIIFLTPVFIFMLLEYIKSGKARYCIGSFFLGGFFFNSEMAYGLFVPLIITALVFILNKNLLKKRVFWVGSTFFFLWLVPQILFDLRHDFLLSKAIFSYFNKSLTENADYNLLSKIAITVKTYYAAFSADLMNRKILIWLTVPALLFVLLKDLKKETIKKEPLLLTGIIIISIPFIGQILSPAKMMLWHTTNFVAVVPILIGYLVYRLSRISSIHNVFSLIIIITILYLSIISLRDNYMTIKALRADPAFYNNEIDAIDYVYKYANGQNFKVYTYLPSVYDYPYQYLFWWYGQKKYGYLPAEYTYSPDKPSYVPSQDKFLGSNDKFSGLVFLIKEPDRNYTRPGWEGAFIGMEKIEKIILGPLEVEVRKEKLF